MEFRNRLRLELVERCKRNPSYSLRAFATQLGTDASTLSKLLKGKRPLGRKLVVQLGTRIGLSASELSPYLSPSTDSEEEIPAHENFQQLTLDRFAVISDWYHFAILELMLVKDFRPDHAWIASALGLKRVEVDVAVERLIRVGMLKLQKDGSWKDTSRGFSTSIGPDMVSAAHRRLQEQFLEKSRDALAQTPIHERDHSTMTMAVNRSRLPAAREKIKKFRRSLARFLTEGSDHDEILNLNIALFPITKLNERKDP